jgi:hypothetical protein
MNILYAIVFLANQIKNPNFRNESLGFYVAVWKPLYSIICKPKITFVFRMNNEDLIVLANEKNLPLGHPNYKYLLLVF